MAEPAWSSLVDALAREQSRWLNVWRTWCAQTSWSEDPNGLEAMAGLLTTAFGELDGAVVEVGRSKPMQLDGPGGTSTTFCDHPVPIIRFAPEVRRRILLSGHFDTVYPPDSPFREVTARPDGRLHGPGVADMKGGLLVMLEAVRLFRAMPEAGDLGVDVVLSPDEEIGSRGVQPFLEEAASRVQAALVFEPATRPDGTLVRRRKGNGTFTLTATGRAAHSGRDFAAGRNAIVALAPLLRAIHGLNERFPDAVVNVANVRGGGPVNIVPGEAVAQLNIRIDSAADGQALAAALRELLETHAMAGVAFGLKGGFTRPPREVGPADEALYQAYAAGARELGESGEWRDLAGGSEGGNLSALGVPVLDGLGVIGADLHSEREWAEIASLPRRAVLAARLLYRLATAPDLVP